MVKPLQILALLCLIPVLMAFTKTTTQYRCDFNQSKEHLVKVNLAGDGTITTSAFSDGKRKVKLSIETVTLDSTEPSTYSAKWKNLRTVLVKIYDEKDTITDWLSGTITADQPIFQVESKSATDIIHLHCEKL